MTTAYGAGALRRAVERVQSAPQQGRNHTLYAQARGVFELSAGGEIEGERVWCHLAEAGRTAGLDPAEIKATLRSAQRDGAKNPRQSSSGTVEAPPSIPPMPPTYPPLRVVETLWNATESVLEHEDACVYLKSRGLDPELASRHGRCRYLPRNARFPKALFGELRATVPKVERDGVWKHAPAHGYRLLFPMVDNVGNVRSLQLRCLEEGKPKAVPLKPQKRGLVLANRAGLALLRRDPGRSIFWQGQRLEVVIVEGETDFLCAACEPTNVIRAIFGVSSGAWSVAHATAIPEAATVIIATDADGPGDQYADKIRGTMGARSVQRWTPNRGKDVCDAGGLSGGTIR